MYCSTEGGYSQTKVGEGGRHWDTGNNPLKLKYILEIYILHVQEIL